jgi:4-hydroxyacetophenone monooxygenase
VKNKRSKYAGKTITEDDDAIAKALEDVSIPTLMMSMIHMSGDASLLDGDMRPVGIYLNEVQGFMSEEDQAKVRADALKVIAAYRDGGCELPPDPDPETIHRMMNFILGEEVPPEYVPMMLEELELDGEDARDLHWGETIPEQAKKDFHAVVIGCGMSGLVAAIRLHEAGIPYTVIEKNAGTGGTWYENRYPGCRVDVGNHFYCYSFEPNDEWSEFFSQHDELRRYFEDVLDKYGVAENVRFETEVVAAKFDDDSEKWTVTVRNADGSEDTIVTNAVISAVGQLNRPKLPEIEGIDTFKGPSMHSSHWIEGTDVKGKRVAVIGTGASAFQIVPSIAEDAEQLYVFQRSAPWMFPNANYHEKVGDGVKWALKHLPFYGRWYRFLLFWPGCDGGLAAMRVDPDWPHPERAVNELNDAAREFFTQYMLDQVGDDDELKRKVIPDYVCLGKRTLQDNGSWLGALTRDDVDLVTDPIARITENGVVCEDGNEYEVDIIVYATGFYANRYLWPMDIVGRGGTLLSEQWGEEPTAYLGITVPNFPNLFCLYGPGTNLAHGGSLIFHSECQIRYVMGCLAALLRDGYKSIECKPNVHDDYVERIQAELDKMVWSHPSITSSWYRNDKGRIYILSPWRLVDYWQWTKQPNLDEFTLTK